MSLGQPLRLHAASADSPTALLRQLEAAGRAAAAGAPLPKGEGGAARLAVLAAPGPDLAARLLAAQAVVRGQAPYMSGVYFHAKPAGADALAFVFPGQGSQRPGMLAGLAVHFAPFRRALADLDELATPVYGRSLRALIDTESAGGSPILTDTLWAQASLGLMGAALARAWRQVGLRPRFTAGHSYGELLALWQGGALDAATLFELSRRRGELMREAGREAPGGMLAVMADERETAALVGDAGPGVEIANLNTDRQTVVAGSDDALEALVQLCQKQGLNTVRLATACAFHSRAMAGAQSRFREDLIARQHELRAPQDMTVLANHTAQPYPREASHVPELLSAQIASRVRWRESCTRLQELGARVFLEVGPGRVLTRMLQANLEDRSCTLLASDPLDADGRGHLLDVLAQLHAHGVELTVAGWGDDLLHPAPPHSLGSSRAPRTPAEPRVEPSAPEGARADPRAFRVTGPHRHQGAAVVIDSSPVPGKDMSLFLRENNDVVRRYLELSARVLDAVGAAPAAAVDAQMLTRFIELNAGVTTRYLDLQHGAFEWLRHDPAASSRPLPAAPEAEPPTPTRTAPRAAARTAGSEATRADETLSWLQGELSSITGFPQDALGAEMLLAELGVDSLAQASLLERIATRVPDARLRARELASARSIGALAELLRTLPAPGWLDWLKDAIAQLTGFPQEAIGPDVCLSDLGIDSLAFASLLESAVTRAPAVKDLVRELYQARTVGEAARILDGTRSGADALPRAVGEPAAAAAMPRGGEARITRELMHVLSERAPRALTAPESDLEKDAGLSPFEVDAAVAALEPGHPTVRLAGEQLRSCATVAEMAERLETLARVQPITDRISRYELQLREVARPRTARPPSVVLVGRDPRTLEALAHASGGETTVITSSATGFALPEGLQVPIEEFETLAGILSRGTADAPWGVVFVAGATDSAASPSDALEADLVTLQSLAKALSMNATPPARLAVVCLAAGETMAAGARGLARALDREWSPRPTSVSAVVVRGAFDADGVLVAAFAEEACTDWILTDGELRRESLVALELPPAATETQASFGPEDVVVLVGGAVGIAAEMGIALATRFGCAVAAVGRTPYDGHAPFADLDDDALGAAVHLSLEPEGTPVPAERLRIALAQARRQRAIHATAERMRAGGRRFAYFTADARDRAALAQALRGVEAAFGRISIVIHAAGVVDDAPLERKSLESFRRVVQTKALSAHHLRETLAGHSPRLVVLLSSMVAHTGNVGQTDYCAANEAVNALAEQWSRESSGRVVALLWSVWGEVGLANRGIRDLMEREGIQPIGTEHGVERFLREALRPRGPSWVLIASARSIAFASGTAGRVELTS